MYFLENIKTLKEFSNEYKYLEVVESQDFRDADVRLRLRYDDKVAEYRIPPKDLISRKLKDHELLSLLDMLANNMINDMAQVLKDRNKEEVQWM